MNKYNNQNSISPEVLNKMLLDSIINIPGDTIIYSIDRNYCYLSFNKNYEIYLKETFNISVEIGMCILEIFKDFQDTKKEKVNFDRAFTGKEFFQIGNDLIDHKYSFYKDIYKPIFDDKGNVFGVTVFYTDITERKKSDRTWAFLLKIAERVNTPESLERFISGIRSELHKIIDTTNFYVALYKKKNDTYSFPYYSDEKDVISKFESRSLKKSLTDYVRRTGIPLLLSEDSIKKMLEKGEALLYGSISPSFLAVPLRYHARIIGVMAVQSHNKVDLYDEKDLHLMTYVSDFVARAVERKRRADKNRQIADQLHYSQKIARLGYWEIDLQTGNTRLSNGAKKIYGLNSDETWIPATIVEKLIFKEDLEKIRLLRKSLSAEQSSYSIDFRMQNKEDKQTLLIHSYAEIHYSENNEALKITGIIQDITQQHHDKLELAMAKDKAEEADRLKSAFLANMSHEIRTPMNAVMGFSKLLVERDLSSEMKIKYASFINSSAKNLLKLINDILDVAKIEAGEFSISKKSVRINSILEEVKETFSQQKDTIAKEHIQINLKIANEDPNFAIVTDQLRFRQIFTNLLGNALKFIEVGKIEFGYTFKNSNTLKFFVSDTGIGIPKDKQKIIFSRFGQIIDDKVTHPGGTGLGLSISKHLVEVLGGEINFVSTLGQGTTFYFTLPLEIAHAEKEKDIGEVDFSIFKGLKILVAEDNKINQVLLEDTLGLNKEQNQITFAENGKQAVEKFKKGNFNLIFMDIRMPELNGYQATKQIRAFETTNTRVPIIGLSAHAMIEAKKEGLQAGMNDFITKPFVPEDLFKVLIKYSSEILTTNSDEKNKIIETKQSFNFKYINLVALKNLYKNDDTKLKKVVLLYIDNIDQQCKGLEENMKEAKIERAKICAHSLKTAFKYFGMDANAELAKEIEMNTEKYTIETLLSKTKELQNQWEAGRNEAIIFCKS